MSRHRSIRIAAALIPGSFIALAACKLPDSPSHNSMVEGALPNGVKIPLKWTAAGNPDSVSHGWLKSFHDPRLNVIVAEAIANNPDLRQAAAKVKQARETVVLVSSQLKPQVGLSLGGHRIRDDDSDGAFTSKQAVAGIAWEPDVWGKVRSQAAAAQAGAEAAAFDYAFARQSLAAPTAKAWYLTTETLQLESLAQRNVDLNAQLLKLVNARREAGKVDDLDVSEANANLSSANGGLAQAKGLAAESRRALETLVGRYPAAELQAAADFSPVPPPVRAGLPASLIQRRPDLVAAEMAVLAAFWNKQSASLAFYPDFSLGLNAGKLSDGLISLLRLNPWMLQTSVGMAVPVYTAGALEAELKIADAKQEQAVAGYGSAALAAFQEVEDALANESVLAAQLNHESQALRDREESVRISQIQFKAGKSDLLSLIQLQDMQIATEAQVIQLRNAQLANRINLHLALGGDFITVPPKRISQQ